MDPGNIDKEIRETVNNQSGINLYEHSHGHITRLIDTYGFKQEKRARFIVFKNIEKTEEMISGVYVVKR